MFNQRPRHDQLAVWADHIRQDLSYAWRGLRRSPAFTLAVVAVLALGLGANAALFALLDRVFLEAPSGVGAPHEVRRLYYFRPNEARRAVAPTSLVYAPASYPEYAAIRDAASGNVAIAAYMRPDSVEAHVDAATVPMMVSYVTRSYFDVLHVRPALGRVFAADEDHIEVASSVAVISDALWHRQFSGDRSVLGRQVAIGDRRFTIVGIAPPDFSGIDLDRADIWLPLGAFPTPSVFSRPWYFGGMSVLCVIARFPSDDMAQRVTSIATLAYRRARGANGSVDTTSRVLTGRIVAALGPGDRGLAESISLRLSGVSLVLLLIACANAANMLLVRATRRRRELAIRRALGISATRLAWQLMIEGLLLSMIAGIVGAFVGVWGGSLLRALLMPEIRWAGAGDHARLIAFTMGACLIAGPLAALAPAVRSSRADLSDALKAGGHAVQRDRAWVRTSLLVGQAALSVLLLVGAGLFLRSLRNVRAIDLGFDPRGLITVSARFHAPARKAELAPALEQIAARISTLPSVERVAMASIAPLHGAYTEELYLPGRDSVPSIDGVAPTVIPASPEYFSTVGVRLISGRIFDSTDRASAPRVAVVSTNMARTVWPGESPLGKCIKTFKRSAPCTTVVGVVEDAHSLGLIEKHALMQLYLPLAQNLAIEANPFEAFSRVLLVRARSDADGALMTFIRRAVRQRLPDVDVLRIDDMSQVVEPEMRPWRLGATLFALMGILAAVVAAVGVYGVIAFAVSQRTHEMGVRLALGARWTDIVGLIVGEGSRVVVFGILIGVGLALALGRLLESSLYGVSAYDPLVLAGACALLGLVGIVASLLPALRASQIDPASSLRAE